MSTSWRHIGDRAHSPGAGWADDNVVTTGTGCNDCCELAWWILRLPELDDALFSLLEWAEGVPLGPGIFYDKVKVTHIYHLRDGLTPRILTNGFWTC